MSTWLTVPALFVGIMSLSACASLPEIAPVDSAERQAKLAALTEFSFDGGLGVWTDEQSVSARIQWQQSDDRLDVQLTGPLGIGDIKLVDTGDNATVSRGGKVISAGPSIDKLLQDTLGLTAPVPVQQLKRWVIGVPGNATSFVADAQDKLSSLRFTDDQGTRWQARFLRYTNLDGLELPSLITASGGPYSVRLLLKNWRPTVHSDVQPQKGSNTRLAIPTR